MYKIYAWLSNSDLDFRNTNGGSAIDNLSRINIFIGANNSGKSKFMREMMRMDSNKITLLKEKKIQAINSIFEPMLHVANQTKWALEDESLPLLNWKLSAKDFQSNGQSSWDVFPISEFEEKFHGPFGIEIYKSAKSIESSINASIKTTEIENIKFTYFPILRTSLNNISESSILKDKTYNNYFIKSYPTGIYNHIFSGENIYKELTTLLLNDQNARKRHLDFEEYLSSNFFLGKQISLIPRHDPDPQNKELNVLHIKIGEDPEVPIYLIGDGIQSIILLTFPLFFNQDKGEVIFFYEEPDMFLHPGLQRTFLQTLLRPEFKEYQYFFTTHSNHFLDMSLDYDDISIYSFRKESSTKILIQNVSSPDHNLLADLGVRNSSVFLTNCTIWVEGITDRIYIRKFLELYQKTLSDEERKYFEDRHYSFVEYSGANITHWGFLPSADEEHPNIDFKHLCGDIFLIADSDNSAEGSEKFNRLIELIKSADIHGEVLEVKEIENLLGPQTINAAAEATYGLPPAEISPDALKTDYSRWNIGFWLAKIWPDNKDTFIQKSKKDPEDLELGTIRKKLEFAKNAVKAMEEFEDLSDKAQALTKKIYQFIKDKNKD